MVGERHRSLHRCRGVRTISIGVPFGGQKTNPASNDMWRWIHGVSAGEYAHPWTCCTPDPHLRTGRSSRVRRSAAASMVSRSPPPGPEGTVDHVVGGRQRDAEEPGHLTGRARQDQDLLVGEAATERDVVRYRRAHPQVGRPSAAAGGSRPRAAHRSAGPAALETGEVYRRLLEVADRVLHDGVGERSRRRSGSVRSPCAAVHGRGWTATAPASRCAGPA